MERFAIVICNYNYDRFLVQAIESALAQDYPDTHVIVVDDGSTDSSRELIKQYESRISAVFKENGGQVSAYNRAIELLDAEYAIFLDSDDLLYRSAVSDVVAVFKSGNYAKVQFRLDVIDSEGALTGAHVPHSEPPADCGSPLRRGWLYPSPPGSGNAYRVSALKRIFPIPESAANRYGADFYAIYGVVLLGGVGTISRSLGGYRVHQSELPSVSFANSESIAKLSTALSMRWGILHNIVHSRLAVDLPPSFHDFSHEKARFCTGVYRATLGARWQWMARESHGYLHSIVANPFWSVKKKLGTLALSSLCLLPYSPLSDFAVRYIVNPLARRPAVSR